MSRHGYSRKSNTSIFKGTLHSSHFVLSSQFDKWSQQGKEHCWALPTAFWLLQSSDCRIWFEKLPKKSKKKTKKRRSIIQTCAENWSWNNLTSIPSLLFVFYSPWEACESCCLLCTHPNSKAPCPSAPGCLLTARLSKRKLWVCVERCVSNLEAS